MIASGSSITYTNVVRGISGATKSVSIAPDMMAHPGLVSALISRAKKAKSQNQPFAIKLVLDASEEALGNPAFGECLADAAAQYDLDVQIRCWPGTAEIFQLMHHKFMIVDQDDPADATLYNGSANYSAKALEWSFETSRPTPAHRIARSSTRSPRGSARWFPMARRRRGSLPRITSPRPPARSISTPCSAPLVPAKAGT